MPAEAAARALIVARVLLPSEVIPLRGKVPTLYGRPFTGWQTHEFHRADFGQPGLTGVGIRLGRVVDVDCDCPEAVELAPAFLPPTFTFGRPSVGRAHWLYLPNEPVVTKQYADPNAGPHAESTMIVELRALSAKGTSAQSMGPGSQHPSGESVRVFDECAPAPIDADDLRRRVLALAQAVFARRYGAETSARWAPVDGVGAAERADDSAGADVVRRAAAAGLELPPGFTVPLPTSWNSSTTSVVQRAAAYVARMPPAVGGGSAARAELMRVTRTLIARFDLAVDEALQIMRADWNRRCQPAWTERELRRAAADADSYPWRTRGDLL
jgi:hypothetical protein